MRKSHHTKWYSQMHFMQRSNCQVNNLWSVNEHDCTAVVNTLHLNISDWQKNKARYVHAYGCHQKGIFYHICLSAEPKISLVINWVVTYRQIHVHTKRKIKIPPWWSLKNFLFIIKFSSSHSNYSHFSSSYKHFIYLQIYHINYKIKFGVRES